MNAVEIEQAVSLLAEQPLDPAEFPFEFLRAFGNKETVIRRLRSGNNNASDVPGGVLQRNNIHMATCAEGQVTATLRALRDSPRTAANKVRFILTTDGVEFQAEDLTSDDPPVICEYAKFPDRFGFFLPLAGITTVKQIRESAFDIRATGRLNRLYRQLLNDNPDWDRAERRPDMNHFMARLIFCFFAEDTGIFNGEGLFTRTVDQMSERDAANTHEVTEAIFRAMNTPVSHDGRPDDRYRRAAGTPRWADPFPYVNGGLFSGDLSVPRFSRIARSYFLTIGGLDWTQINPDIFGSMIQAVADDEERGELGMHYTSVPNILKVLNPLFLDELRAQLEAAGDNPRALLNLRKRMSRIRVFDPACGSGNFLVIAYKEMRAIEAEINRLRGEADRRSDIPLTNFRGIELRDFAAEVARLALIIAEYQADVQYRGQREALAEFLPLDAENWITCANALQVDWLTICPSTGDMPSKIFADDLFGAPLDQRRVEFENEGGETYICGNPPYLGSRVQDDGHKDDLEALAARRIKKWKSLDYVAGWLLKGADYLRRGTARFAFVTTSSMCEGLQVSILWPIVLGDEYEIFFAHRPFRWSNLASKNAAVSVVIAGVRRKCPGQKTIYYDDLAVSAVNINAYLIATHDIYVHARPKPLSSVAAMITGAMPRDGGHLACDRNARDRVISEYPQSSTLFRPYVGSFELINGGDRYCLWISDYQAGLVASVPPISERLRLVTEMRANSPLESTRGFQDRPHRFVYLAGQSSRQTIAVGSVSSVRRQYLPAAIFKSHVIVSDLALALYDAETWHLSLICSRLHVVWIATVCGKMKTDYRYSNTLGWNTFPVPVLTAQNRADLTHCAEDILLAREAHWPATMAELYDPDQMPDDLRRAHERNDEALERIYIGRRFRNDTERLEKLFDLYTKMTAGEAKTKGTARAR